MATLSGNKIKDTYQSLIKLTDNGNLTTGAKQLTDGFGNNSPLYISTTQIGIGVTPEATYDLHVYSNAKVGGNLTVTGDLTVEGTTTTIDTQTLTVEDPLIEVASNNTSTDAVDIGWYGKYAPSGTVLYAGLFRDTGDSKFKLFKSLEEQPTTTVNTSGTGYTRADLVIGNLEATQVDLGDNEKIRFGASQDIEIYYNGTTDRAYFDASSANQSIFIGGTQSIIRVGGTQNALVANHNGNVSLNYSGATKLSTSSTGITVEGIVASDGLDVGDSEKIRLGDSQDLEIYHNGSHSYIDNNTGDIIIRNDAVDKGISFLADDGAGGSENYVYIDGGAFETKFYKDTKHLDSVKAFFGTGSDLQIWSTGSTDYISSNNNSLIINSFADNKSVQINTTKAGGSLALIIKAEGSTGEALLYHLGVEKLKTSSTGVTVTGTIIADGLDLGDSEKIRLGTGNDLEIFHDGNNSYVQDFGTGDFYVRSNSTLFLKSATTTVQAYGSTETIANFIENGAVELYYDNSKKLETTTTGVTVTGRISGLTDPSAAQDAATKAYVDTVVGGNNELSEVLANGNTTGGTDIAVSTGDDITFADGSSAYFGTGNDLRLYHSGSSAIMYNGVGNMTFTNYADDSDIIFQSDNGSGGVATYYYLDGSEQLNRFQKNILLPDGVNIALGSSFDLQLYHDGGTQSFISNTTGNLIIQNTADNSDIIFKSDDGAGGVAEYFRLDGSTATFGTYRYTIFPDYSVLAFGSQAFGDLRIFHDGTHSYIYDAGTGRLNVRTSQFRVVNAANSEIIIDATENGSVDLYYDNSKKFETTSTGVQVTGTTIIDQTANTDVNGLNGIRLNDSTGTIYAAIGVVTGNDLRITAGDAGGTGNTAIAFRTATSGSESEKMRIDNSGQVQLNSYGSGTFTGTATYRLAVDSSGEVIEIPIGDGAVDGSGAAGQVAFWTDTDTIDGENNLYWDSSNDRLGIGTSSPDATLEINNSTVSASLLKIGQDSTGYWQFTNAGNPVSRVALLAKDSSGVTKISLNPTSSSYFNNGNIGIGTSSPNSILEIQSSSPEMTIGGSALNQFESGRIRFTEQRNATAGFQGGYIHYDGSTNKLHLGMHNTSDTTVGNDANAITILRTNQNVGIGTDSPTQSKLVVDGTISIPRSEGFQYLESISGAFRAGIFSTDTNATGVGFNSLRFFVNSDSTDAAMVIGGSTNTKNVGIGTDSPATILELGGSTNTALTISKTGDLSTGLQIGRDSTTLASYIIQRENADLFIRTNNTERMRITSGGRVGINKTNPTTYFQVNSGTENSVAIFESSDANANIKVVDSNATVQIENNYGKLILGADLDSQQADSYISFEIDGASEKMRIDSSGRVGIGTSSPERQLSLYSNNTETTPRFLIEQDGTGDAVMAFSLTGGQGWSMGIDNSGGDSFMIHDSSGGVDSSSQFTITTAGNVGIGTTVVDDKLHILGDSAKIQQQGQAGITLKFNHGNNASINSDINIANIKSFVSSGSTGSEGGGIAFETKPTSGTATERMRIDSSGSVGIGTTSPSAKLQISTTMTSSPTSNIFLDVEGSNINGGGGSIIFATSASAGSTTSYNAKITGTRVAGGTGGDSQLGFWTTLVSDSVNPQERMTITKEGYVGIGTSSPSYKLHVEGNSYINATGDSACLTLGRYSGRPTIKAGTDDSGYLIMDSSGGRAALNWYSGDHVVLAHGGGNVGIGTTSPTEKLEIAGDVKIQGADSGNAGVLHFGNDSDQVKISGFDSGGSSVQNTLLFSTNSTERMRIDSSGNVGIGDTTPEATLTVKKGSEGAYFSAGGDTANNRQLVFTSSNGNGSNGAKHQINATSSNGIISLATANVDRLSIGNTGIIQIDGYGNGAYLRSIGTVRIDIDSDNNQTDRSFIVSKHSAGDELFRVQENGNVGIGTTSPASKLHLFNAGYPQMSLESNGGTWQVGVSSGNDFAFRKGTSGSDYPLWLDSSSNVGIGTTNPDEKLVVYGSVNNDDIAIKIKNTYDDNTVGSAPASALILESASNNGYIRLTGSPADVASEHILDIGSTATGNEITFTTQGTERLRVDASGNVGIGETSPSDKLEVTTSASQFTGRFDYTGSSGGAYGCLKLRISANTSPSFIDFFYDGYSTTNAVGAIVTGGTNVLYQSYSDYRLKENVEDLTGALDRVNNLQPKTFNYINAPETTNEGFIAHELQEVVPQAVSGIKDGTNEDGTPKYQGVDNAHIVPLLVGAIKELKQEIETLKAQINN